MASAPFSSVSVECVNICKYSKGDGSGRYDCSPISCAWKAPRALTGLLASTAHSSSSSAFHHGQSERRSRHIHRCEAAGRGAWLSLEDLDQVQPRILARSSLLHCACRKWAVGCSSSSSSGYNDVSPERLWEDLKPAIAYLTSDELKLVQDALNLAFEAHDGQKRRSGEPFIIHPVEVARILGELELDWESIAAGLLHDTVEDTNLVTFEKIEEQFGATVHHIVEGETKVSKLGKLKYKNENHSVQDVKAHDLRQMFLAMTEEVRVIIVKLADRLHNMRTLSHMPSHKQASIAMETLQVFAPLAKLLGMYQIKSELENLSFMYTNPQDYAKVKRRIAELSKEQDKEIEEAHKILIKRIEDDQFLDLLTVKTEVRSVCKEPYSIYKSVLKSKGSINEVNQIAQLRIIVRPKPCVGVGPLCNAQQICYHVLGLVHGIWTPIPRAMKDYIATPKPNGYQSLHTTVIPFLYESMFRLEVQIRTEEMDLIAERGIAAHYSGKVIVNGLFRHTMANDRNLRGKPVCLSNANVALRIGWLNAIREWQEEFVGNMSSREFVDTITKDLLGSRVFVFTPRGEIKNLPKGATVIDYAYMISTDVGNSMVAAKVNGNIVPPLHVLANAEVVEIVTYNALSSKSAFQRHKQWLQHAKTRSARHKIMKFLKEQAAQSATQLTVDSVNEFLADSGDDGEAEEVTDYSKGSHHTWEKILMNVMEMSSMKMIGEDLFQFRNGGIKVPKVNGKHNKKMKDVSLKSKGDTLYQGNGVAKMIFADVPMYKEVLPGLENWRDGKVASWSDFEGHSIQWMCIVCIDRKGMLADISKTLADVGVTICSCAAEVDKERGMAVILFHVEPSLDNMVSACSRVDLVLGVLGWSTGCSWSGLTENQLVQEC
ncbi:HD/PDEase domain, RelA/SpoT family, Beta-grasp domain protein [Artemisia annua]|uniref:Putative GTP diphosphokinase RSH1, chloroplastic n=1 Tax=Artemisia annua TaxID=35608 RepID=A0A2U1MXD3_ARTAN|nr:HD/PDEase domain, RelA/SpoT family, Beta-grasp domain protein [Artemisia annua]